MSKTSDTETRKRVGDMVKILGKEYPDARTALHFTNPLELLVATIPVAGTSMRFLHPSDRSLGASGTS